MMNLENSFKDSEKIKFTGTVKDYFGIWISNLILSIITFGIYSAWAKVRRERFFKNNTKIFNKNFGYHASGGQIFKGRFIAFLILIALNVISTIMPILGGILVIVLVFIFPLILNKSMKFSARVTSYRNIRFNWHGKYWKTFWFFLLAPLLGLLSLGFLTPLISKSYYYYFARSHSYGTSFFSCNPKVSHFYIAFLIGGILPTIIISCIFILFVYLQITLTILECFKLPAIIIYTLIFCMIFIYKTLCRNILLRSLVLEDVIGFNSNINPLTFIWISLSNLVLILISLGLLIPLARVRMYKYLSNCTMLFANKNMNGFIDEMLEKQSSTGEEFAELEGIEVTI